MAVVNDFTDGPLADFAVTVTRTPVTVTTDFHGNKTYTDASTENISVVFFNPNTNYDLDKGGLIKSYEAKMFTKATQTMNKYDKIQYDSKIYRVETVSLRIFNGTNMFKTVILFYMKNA